MTNDQIITKKVKKLPVRPHRYVTVKDLDKMISVIKKKNNYSSIRNQVLLYMMFYFGLRVSEAANFTWSMVDFDSHQIHVARLKNGKNHTFNINICKNIQHAKLFRLLKKLRTKNQFDHYLFSHNRPAEGGISRAAVHKIVRRTSLEAGFENPFHPHMFRHGCGHFFAFNDVPAQTIMKILGHRSILNTQRYIDANDKQVDNALLLI